MREMASVARRWTHAVWSALAFALSGTEARAEPFRPGELTTSDAYMVSLEARQTHVTRTEFDEALFLVSQPVDRIVANQLSLTLSLRYALDEDLELSAALAVAHRTAALRFSPVVISPEQTLPPVWLELENRGFLDPELGARYRLLKLGPFAFHAGVFGTLPGDDNPSGQTLPSKLPLSTGQASIRFAPSLSLGFEQLFFRFDYALGYHPRAAATYLVRRVDNQSYANGALGEFFTHDFRVTAALRASAQVTLELAAFGAVEQNPAVIEAGRTLPFVYELLRYELGASARVRFRLSRRHALGLAYDAPFARAWESDPFFPIALPAQGLNVSWSLSGS
jgi:hypothetical protein